ncbi:MAG: oxygen-dependent coproporphyrinogen oxidase [Oligoflexia bacterium]|nr:oxygen-dependent coproporphyrinogen oxidase [Oligoflexia bacterium]
MKICDRVSEIEDVLLTLQQQIINQLEREDGQARFCHDRWEKREQLQGYGETCVLEEGASIEKAGVNFSKVEGQVLPLSIVQKRPELQGASYLAMGVSLVIHPRNPYAPITHANIRFFCTGTDHWWFGGGMDLTPIYLFEEDCTHWHQQLKQCCDAYAPDLYPRLKKWCDDYFYLPHRNEYRGIGGIFFDDLCEWEFARCLSFAKSVGEHFIPAYLPLLQKRKQMHYGEKERAFQLYRRGRYVEFNLVYDQGTRFGLQSGGRIESILMSLPPMSSWKYNWKVEKSSNEELLMSYLQHSPRDWVL